MPRLRDADSQRHVSAVLTSLSPVVGRSLRSNVVAILGYGPAFTFVALSAIGGGVAGHFVADAVLAEADIDYAYGIGAEKWAGLVLAGAVIGVIVSVMLILVVKAVRRSRRARAA